MAEIETETETDTFTFTVGVDIRAYGTVDVEADDLDQAVAKLNANYVSEHLDPFADPDAFDWNTPLNISVLDDGIENCAGTIAGVEQFNIPNGDWEGSTLKKMKAFIRELAALTTPEQEFSNLDQSKGQDYENVEEYKSDISGDRAYDEYLVLAATIAEAQTLAKEI